MEDIEKIITELKDIIRDAIALLKEYPEIVYCKDCKRNISTPHNPMCELDAQRSGGNCWFCADGERK